MFEGVVKVLKEFKPARLSAINVLWLTEILEILMVSTNTDSMFCSKDERVTALKPIDDRSEFFIMRIIVAFGGKEVTRMEGNGVNAV